VRSPGFLITRGMFTGYLALILGGLALFIVLGLLHR
jgi:hypothetical protein